MRWILIIAIIFFVGATYEQGFVYNTHNPDNELSVHSDVTSNPQRRKSMMIDSRRHRLAYTRPQEFG
jgi:hypothetical protein